MTTPTPWPGVHPEDRATLDQLAANGVPGSLVIVTSPDPGLAFDSALTLARRLVDPAHRDLDVRPAVSDTDRWTIAEVDDLIVRPAHLRAFDRTHVVVADADHMAPAAYDHVLKTVEEPSGGAQFWFCVSDADRLPVTLRGRAGAQLLVRPAPAAEQVEQLRAAGCTDEHAAAIAAHAAGDLRLGLAVAARPDLIGALARYAAARHDRHTAPTREADAILTDVFALAAAFTATSSTDSAQLPGKTRRTRKPAAAKPTKGPRPRWDSLTPAQRADARRLVRRLVTRWQRADIAALPAADRVAVRGIATRLAALDAFTREVATNASLSTALPALLARCA